MSTGTRGVPPSAQGPGTGEDDEATRPMYPRRPSAEDVRDAEVVDDGLSVHFHDDGNGGGDPPDDLRVINTPPPSPNPKPNPAAQSIRYPGITRLLCSTAHLLPEFGDWVRGELVMPGFRGTIPCPGIDLVALGQHAFEARLRRERRDSTLRLLLYVWPFAVVVGLLMIRASRLSGMASFVLFLAIIAAFPAAAFAVVVRYMLACNRAALAVAYPDNHEQPVPPTPVNPTDPGVPPLPINGVDAAARSLAPPLPAKFGATERLEALRTANAVVFGGDSPFAGSGRLYDTWTVTVDTRKPTEGKEGKPGPTASTPFIAAELHDYLERHVPIGTVPDLEVSRRLYVSGWAVEDIPLVDLAEAKAERPRQHVPASVVDDHIASPGEGARTYSCFEVFGWRGQLQPSVYLRCSLTKDMLFVEASTYLLPPIGAAFYEAERISMHKSTEFWEVFSAASNSAMGLFFRAPYRIYTRKRNGKKGGKKLEEFVEEITLHRRRVNQGGTTSVRQVAAHLDTDYQFALADEAMYVQILNLRILDCVREFLVANDVDPKVFDNQYLNIYTAITAGIRKLRKSAINR